MGALGFDYVYYSHFKGGFYMENIFNVKCNTELDKLKIRKDSTKFKKINFFRKHKFFTVVLMSFFIFSGINFYLIYSFMKILENI